MSAELRVVYILRLRVWMTDPPSMTNSVRRLVVDRRYVAKAHTPLRVAKRDLAKERRPGIRHRIDDIGGSRWVSARFNLIVSTDRHELCFGTSAREVLVRQVGILLLVLQSDPEAIAGPKSHVEGLLRRSSR